MKIKLIDTGQEVELIAGLHFTSSLINIYDKVSFVCASSDGLRVNSKVNVTDDDDNIIIRGFVGSLSPSKTESMTIYTVVSFSNLLIHGCPIVSTGEFINSTNVAIINSLLLSYDMYAKVEQEEYSVLIPKYNVNLDMPLVDTIYKLCNSSGLTPTASPNGLFLFKDNPDNTTTSNEILLHDANSNFSCILTNEYVGSEYEVVGEGSFSNEVDATQYGQRTEGMLPFPKRIRTSYDGLANISLCDNKVLRVRNIHDTSYEQLKARIEGCVFITKGELVTVNSNMCRINGIRMVETVEIFRDTEGSEYTVLTLCFPSKYGGVASSISEWIK